MGAMISKQDPKTAPSHIVNAREIPYPGQGVLYIATAVVSGFLGLVSSVYQLDVTLFGFWSLAQTSTLIGGATLMLFVGLRIFFGNIKRIWVFLLVATASTIVTSGALWPLFFSSILFVSLVAYFALILAVWLDKNWLIAMVGSVLVAPVFVILGGEALLDGIRGVVPRSDLVQWVAFLALTSLPLISFALAMVSKDKRQSSSGG